MRLQVYHLVSLVFLLAQVASANFDLYWEYQWDPRWPGAAYKVFGDRPRNCDDPAKAHGYGATDDVSGNKLGIRCKGNGCTSNEDPSGVIEMEMHFGNNPHYHWTIYRDRDPRQRYQMFPLEGYSVGYCFPFPGDEYQCGHDHGYRKFRCITSYNADDINKSLLASLKDIAFMDNVKKPLKSALINDTNVVDKPVKASFVNSSKFIKTSSLVNATNMD